jgi:hypothetical protein
MKKRDKLIGLWTAFSFLSLSAFYFVPESVLQDREIVTYAMSCFFFIAAAFIFYIAIDGIKNGIIHFGTGGPFYKSHDSSSFWFSVFLALFLSGTFLFGGIKILL